jgi:hypothetical protein
MRRILLSSAVVFLACGEVPAPTPVEEPCSGLRVTLLEDAVSPPANVAALVRVTDCERRPLGVRLAEESFLISEDGELLSQFETSRKISPADRRTEAFTLIALDLSGSIVRTNLRAEMVNGVRSFVAALPAQHRIAIFGFDGRPDLIPFASFTEDRLELAAALDRVEATMLVDDSTNLNGAVVNALEVLDRAVEVEARDPYAVAQGSLVVFTDGRDLARRVEEDELDDVLDETEHATFSIGVGPGVDTEALAEIGRSGHFLAVDSAAVALAFDSVARDLNARAMQDYVVSYCSPARAGARTLRIDVKHGGFLGSEEMSFDATGFGAGCSPEASPLR